MYNIISPDGFSISQTEKYSTPKKAWEAFEVWKKQYEIQKYYSSVDYGRIPLNHLKDYCKLVKV